MNVSKVIILGHSGFIGKAVLDYIQATNRTPVYGFSSASLDLRNSTALDKLNSIIDDNAVLIIASNITKDRQDNLHTAKENIKMVFNVAEYLQQHPIKKCVYVSSIAVYGNVSNNKVIDENTQISPNSYYAVAKYTSECILHQIAAQTGFQLLILRPTGIFGPNDTHLTYGPMDFINSAVQKKKVRLYGYGEECRDFLYIKDVARLVTELSFKDISGTYNLASGVSHSFREIIEYLKLIIPNDFDVYNKPRKQTLMHHKFDVSKLIGELPKFRFTEFRTALKETYECHSISNKNPLYSSRHP